MSILCKNLTLSEEQQDFFSKNNLFSKMVVPSERIVRPYAWAGHMLFSRVLVSLLQPSVIVELGTHSGNSFCSFCQAVKQEQLSSQCYAIDTWQGDEQAGFYSNEVYDDLNDYVNKHFGEFAALKRMTFDRALMEFEDGSVDLLHIDGLHTYDAVKHDFETWKPKLSDRAVVLFHDISVLDRDFGVKQLWDEIRSSYNHFEFSHSNGLGILQYGKNTPAAFKDFIRVSIAAPLAIRFLFEQCSLLYLPTEAKEYLSQFHSVIPGFEKELYCELFVDTGKGFSEQLRLIKYAAFSHEECEISFDFSGLDKIKKIRLDPGTEPICLQFLQCSVQLDNETWQDLALSDSSSLFVNDGWMIFGSDPWLEFILENKAVQVMFRLKVQSVGYKVLSDFESKLKEIKFLHNQIAEYHDLTAKLYADIKVKDELISSFVSK